MNNFLETTETIGKGLGFKHFSPVHIMWLVILVLISITTAMIYRKCGEKNRTKMRFIVAGFLVADEIFKHICLLIGGNFIPKYIPLHLCSINIFLIAFHVFKRTKVLDNFLYSICMTTSLAALLFPSWTKLPLENFMHIHSFTVHILLFLYPFMLTFAGEIKPDPTKIPKCLLLLLGFAVPAYIVNRIYGTNFMFLMSAGKTNPLYVFETLFGEHLIGYPVYAVLILSAMYLPPYLYKKYKAKKSEKI